MRKLLSWILAFSLLVGSSMTVFAQETTSDSWVEIPATYRIQSYYSIYIPESIDYTDMGYQFTAESMNIADNQYVCIVPYSKTCEMTSSSGASGTLHIESDDTTGNGRVALFRKGQTTSQITMSGFFEGTAEAGLYSGVAQFQIFIEED